MLLQLQSWTAVSLPDNSLHLLHLQRQRWNRPVLELFLLRILRSDLKQRRRQMYQWKSMLKEILLCPVLQIYGMTQVRYHQQQFRLLCLNRAHSLPFQRQRQPTAANQILAVNHRQQQSLQLQQENLRPLVQLPNIFQSKLMILLQTYCKHNHHQLRSRSCYRMEMWGFIMLLFLRTQQRFNKIQILWTELLFLLESRLVRRLISLIAAEISQQSNCRFLKLDPVRQSGFHKHHQISNSIILNSKVVDRVRISFFHKQTLRLVHLLLFNDLWQWAVSRINFKKQLMAIYSRRPRLIITSNQVRRVSANRNCQPCRDHQWE